MAVFFSFHYERDYWRVQQIFQMGALAGQTILNTQEWEAVKRKGDQAIKDWIAEQMAYKTAVVVLVGAQTASRSWVSYEITKAWNDKRPLIGIRIHGLKDTSGKMDLPGANPFEGVKFPSGGSLASYVPLKNPIGANSNEVYASIKANLKTWVDDAYKRP